MTDIIERLSALSAVSTDSSTILTEVKAGIITDAIAEIERLRAEIERLKSIGPVTVHDASIPWGEVEAKIRADYDARTFADIKRDIRSIPK
jgi:hypothetical protein